MCTAISYNSRGRHLFGRTLDVEGSYGEQIVVAPRRFEFKFKYLEGSLKEHSAVIGTARVSEGYPLFFDAVNEDGLAAAALNFPTFAEYSDKKGKKLHSVASYELLPWTLCSCHNLSEAKRLLSDAEIVSDSFSNALPSTPLHWLIADSSGAIAVEPLEGGLKITDNPIGVLTNSPPIDYHLLRLQELMGVSSRTPSNNICPLVFQAPYSQGFGGMGLPGDLSSPSRFCRAVFAKEHTLPVDGNASAISSFFHVMDTVSQPNGCAVTQDGKAIRTVYTSCADTQAGSYYFTTYGNRRIRRIDISRAPSDTELFTVDMDGDEDFKVL